MVKPRAQVDDEHGNYGYLTWLPTYQAGDRKLSAFGMFGNGGNKVVVFPELHSVIVITTTNFNAHQPHAISDRIITDYILPNLLP